MACQSNDNIIDLAEFQALSLSVPLESRKYSFMSMLLTRALNLKDEGMILTPSSYKSRKQVSPVEILPQIAVPTDLWLASDISIRDSKVKISLLKEVNAMLFRCISDLGSGDILALDQNLINTFASRVDEYKLTEFGLRPVPQLDTAFREDDELDFENSGASNGSLKDSPEHTDDASINSESGPSRPGSFAGSRSTSRVSTLSRDFMSGKRKLSIFGQSQTPKPEPASPNEKRKSVASSQTLLQLSPGTSSSETFGAQKSASLQKTGLLSKSKFYNKLVKRRDSSASMTSSASVGGSSPSSYRNSTGGVDTHDSMATAAARNSVLITATQRIENQKDKYRFYAQTKTLGENIQQLTACFGRRESQTNLVTLLEFVKNYIFKFVVVDICHMIVAKSQMSLTRGLSL